MALDSSSASPSKTAAGYGEGAYLLPFFCGGAMRKISAVVLIVLYLTFIQAQQARAFVPALVVPAVIGAAVLTVGAMTYYKPTSIPASWPGSSIMTTAGNIAAVVVGAQMSYNQYNQAVLQGDYAAISASVTSLQSWFSANPSGSSSYPNLSSALMVISGQPLRSNSSPGDVVTVPGMSGFQQVLTVRDSWPGVGQSDCWGSGIANQGYNLVAWEGGACHSQYFTLASASCPAPSPRPIATVQSIMPPGVPLTTPIQDDLAKMIAAVGVGNSTFNVMDSQTASGVDNSKPLVPPLVVPAPLNPAQPVVTFPNSAVGTQVTAAANQAVAAAQTASQALTSAQAAQQNYQAAHPTSTVQNDSALAALAGTTAAAQAAVTAAQVTASQAGAVANSAAAQAADTYPNANIDALKTLDFSPFKSLGGVFASVWPFCLLTSVSAFISPLVSSPVAPVFDLPLPLGTSVHIDLAILDPAAIALRWILALVLTVGAYLGIVRFWRGVA